MADNDMPRMPRIGKRDDDPKMIGLWKVGRTIGKGSSGRVRIARHSKSGQYAAVKIVSKNALLNSRMSMPSLGDEAERILHGIEREIVIMKLIEHPNIMRLYDVWETSTELFLILEYVEGGELFDYLCNKGRLSTSEALGYFQQIITAVDYCHRFNIAHRDLKPENLLLDRDRNIKVADFGMAAWQGKSDMLQTACGSPHYAAPEVIMGQAYNGACSDIWSCGIVLYALLAGRLPFDDEDLPTLLEKVKIGKYHMPADIDPHAKDLISKMLQKDVSKRITMPDILKHPFYMSQAPKAMNCDIPNLDDIARPLINTTQIDPDIFANLRTLWPGVPDDKLSENLTNKKQTWEKGVYHLLVRYREKHLENYDEDEEKLLEKRAAKRSKKANAEPRTEALVSLPPRTGPPTPRRAARAADSSESHCLSPCPSRMQQITNLSSGTPVSRTLEVVSPRTPVRGPRPLSPAGAGLRVPEVADENVQHFFQQIVDHLNVMQSGRPSATRAPTDPAQSPLAAKAPPPTPLHVDLGKPFDVRRQQAHVAHSTPTKPLSIRRPPAPRDSIDGNKENGSYLSARNAFPSEEDDAPERKSSLRSNSTAGGSSRTDRHVQIVEPSPGERAKLRKKRSATSSPTSSAFSGSASDAGSFFFATTPKRSWFGNLFSFKPASYQLLSTQDVYRTRMECWRLLENMGLTVMLTQAEGMGVLKCRLEEYRDPAEVMATVKAVRFRVVVQMPTTVQAIAGYTIALSLVLEKGALSSFKMVYSRLRRDWHLDAPPAGQYVGSARMRDDERFVEVVYAN